MAYSTESYAIFCLNFATLIQMLVYSMVAVQVYSVLPRSTAYQTHMPVPFLAQPFNFLELLGFQVLLVFEIFLVSLLGFLNWLCV